MSIYKKLVKKEPKKPDNEEKVKRNLLDKLKGIAKLRKIKNRDKLEKEDLIISSNAERNNNTNIDNNSNTNVDDTYDSKIRDKITDIRMILGRLGNIVTKTDRKKIKKELYEKSKTFQIRKKKRFIIILSS